MSELLWQKPGVEVDPRIQAFLAGDDVLLDREFIQDDITASSAHARGLARIGILTSDEAEAMCRELAALSEDLKSGAFVLDERFEDCHSAIESRLVERLAQMDEREKELRQQIAELKQAQPRPSAALPARVRRKRSMKRPAAKLPRMEASITSR